MSDDDLLRKHGFTIAARPKNGINVWSRHGKRFEEWEALIIAMNAEEAVNEEKAKGKGKKK